MIALHGLPDLLLSAKRVFSMRAINSSYEESSYSDALFGRIGSVFGNTCDDKKLMLAALWAMAFTACLPKLKTRCGELGIVFG